MGIRERSYMCLTLSTIVGRHHILQKSPEIFGVFCCRSRSGRFDKTNIIFDQMHILFDEMHIRLYICPRLHLGSLYDQTFYYLT